MKKHLHFPAIMTIVFSLTLLTLNAQSPVADFDLEAGYAYEGCGELYVKFKNNSTGATKYEWDFGDASTKQIITNPSHNYDKPGTFIVTLKATNAAGVTNTKTKSAFIRVFKNPVAEFEADDVLGCENHAVKYSDKSTIGNGAITQWQWTFGDASGSSAQNPTTTYKNIGKYNVSLKITDQNKCTDVIDKPSYISVIQKPKAVWSSNTHYFCPPLPNTINVCFTNTSTADTPTYLWDFGDGQTDNTATPCHTYPNTKGAYDVKLKVSSQNECFDSLVVENYVEVNSFSVNFSVDRPSGCVPHKPMFIDLSSSESGTDKAATWNWTFSNGKTSTANRPNTIEFSDTGFFHAKLIVTSQKGCSDTIEKKNVLYVKPLPIVKFSADQTEHCTAPANVQFTDSTLNSNKWLWNFGDGSTSTDKNPLHTFLKSDFFSISLTVFDTNGCSASLSKTSYIGIAEPVALFASSSTKDTSCIPYPVSFRDMSNTTRSIVKWDWNFGDGKTNSTQANPTNIYTDTGEFDIRLIIEDNIGCRDTLTKVKSIQAGEPQSIGFFAADTIGCHKLTVSFTDTSNAYLGGKYIDEWRWDYGLGNSTKSVGGTHTYQYVGDSGWFDVSLTALQNGCPNTFDNDSLVYVIVPVPKFNVVKTISCQYPYVATFLNNSYKANRTYWDFGDTTAEVMTTNEPSITHNYKYPGFYNVTIRVENDTTLCKDTLKQNDHVKISDITPGFTQNKTHICQNDFIIYDDASISLPRTTITTWRWVLGDGFSIFKQNSIPDNDSLKHTYKTGKIYNTKLLVKDDLDCWDSIIKPLNDTVYKLPVAKFEGDTTYGCEPLHVNFSDLSTKADDSTDIIRWHWDFGETALTNDTSAIQNPTYTYLKRGAYTVQIHIWDEHSCYRQTSLSQYIKPSYPYADFSLVTPICKYNNLQITDATTSLIPANYKYYFGDGDSSDLKAPTHLYNVNASAKFQVKLVVTDTNDCVDMHIDTVEISHPVADFLANPPTGDCPPFHPHFEYTVSSDVSKIEWNFGDNNKYIEKTTTDTIINPYFISGSYDVTMISTNVTGCKDTVFKPKYIFIDGPRGSFTFNPLNGCAPVLVTYTATAEKAAKYHWRFMDGTDTITTDSTVTHLYSIGDYYKPRLMLEDALGAGETVTCTAFATPPVDSIKVISGIAGFTINEDTSCSLIDFVLTDTSEVLPVGQKISSWKWHFGDGDSAIVANPTHKYDTAGRYEVNLMITVDQCAFKADSQYIQIFKQPKFDFSLSDSLGCTPVTTTYKLSQDPLNDPVSYWVWDLGDNSPLDTGTTITHTYNTSSITDVILTAILPNGCVTTLSKKPAFGIYERPIARIGSNYDSLYAQHPITFVDSSLGDVTKWTWYLGDNAIETSETFQHVYRYVGNYNVKLIVETPHQCKDSATKIIYVQSRPYIPNAFTPDNDGVNDVFMPFVDLKIINRWGEVLYEGTDGWDGFYKSKLATSGTYYYIITVDDVMNQEPVTFTGPVTLIKK